jgi:hypothetical protein
LRFTVFSKIAVDGATFIEEAADNGSTIIGNMIKEIPGVGLVFAGVQSVSKMGETGIAISNAASSMVKDSAEFVQVTNENMRRLEGKAAKVAKAVEQVQQGGGGPVANRISKSINDFLIPTITLSKVKKMFATRKHKRNKKRNKNKNSKKTYKRH